MRNLKDLHKPPIKFILAKHGTSKAMWVSMIHLFEQCNNSQPTGSHAGHSMSLLPAVWRHLQALHHEALYCCQRLGGQLEPQWLVWRPPLELADHDQLVNADPEMTTNDNRWFLYIGDQADDGG